MVVKCWIGGKDLGAFFQHEEEQWSGVPNEGKNQNRPLRIGFDKMKESKEIYFRSDRGRES